jgi:tetrahydromethanopterin S-methyltransferase subunit G
LCDDFDKTKEVAMGNLIKNQPHSTSNGSVPTNSHDQDVATDTEGKNCNFNSSTSIQSPNHNKHIGKSIGIAIGGLVIGVVLTLLVVLSSKRYRLSSKTVNKKGKMNKKDVVNDGDKKPDDDSEIDAVDFKLENGIMS